MSRMRTDRRRRPRRGRARPRGVRGLRDDEPDGPTRAEFIAKTDAQCKVSNARTKTLNEEAAPRRRTRARSEAQLLRELAPILERGYGQVRDNAAAFQAVNPPPADAPRSSGSASSTTSRPSSSRKLARGRQARRRRAVQGAVRGAEGRRRARSQGHERLRLQGVREHEERRRMIAARAALLAALAFLGAPGGGGDSGDGARPRRPPCRHEGPGAGPRGARRRDVGRAARRRRGRGDRAGPDARALARRRLARALLRQRRGRARRRAGRRLHPDPAPAPARRPPRPRGSRREAGAIRGPAPARRGPDGGRRPGSRLRRGGFVALDVEPTCGFGACRLAALAPDGALVVTGAIGQVSATRRRRGLRPPRWVVRRVTPAGAVDGGFGRVRIPGSAGAGTGGVAVVVRPTGQIVVLGAARDGVSLAGLTAGGARDRSFAGGKLASGSRATSRPTRCCTRAARSTSSRRRRSCATRRPARWIAPTARRGVVDLGRRRHRREPPAAHRRAGGRDDGLVGPALRAREGGHDARRPAARVAHRGRRRPTRLAPAFGGGRRERPRRDRRQRRAEQLRRRAARATRRLVRRRRRRDDPQAHALARGRQRRLPRGRGVHERLAPDLAFGGPATQPLASAALASQVARIAAARRGIRASLHGIDRRPVRHPRRATRAGACSPAASSRSSAAGRRPPASRSRRSAAACCAARATSACG